jgi:hypothetical protein
LRTERPATPVISVPGSAAAGDADQVPTQVPAEAGAAELPGGRPAAARRAVPSSDETVPYMAAERAAIRAQIAASRAQP